MTHALIPASWARKDAFCFRLSGCADGKSTFAYAFGRFSVGNEASFLLVDDPFVDLRCTFSSVLAGDSICLSLGFTNSIVSIWRH
jgi:hypothetical protein